MQDTQEHWNEIFRKTAEDKLGWYEPDFSQTLKFLSLIPGWEKSKIFVAGAGTSGLIDILIKTDAELVINDLSSEAIDKARAKYSDNARAVQWLRHDLSKPLPAELDDVDIWVDRAVLHFLTDDNSVDQYFKNVNVAVKKAGHAMFFEFSKTGASKCAGLDVRRYDVQDLEVRLPLFELVASEEYIYINPNGDPRPYICTLFKRVG